MLHLDCTSLTDAIVGSSYAVLALVAASGKALAQANVNKLELFGVGKMGLLGYVVLAWFALKGYALWMQNCPSQMSNPMIEHWMVKIGIAAGLYSVYLDYYA